jgi:hypothetical protein
MQPWWAGRADPGMTGGPPGAVSAIICTMSERVRGDGGWRCERGPSGPAAERREREP